MSLQIENGNLAVPTPTLERHITTEAERLFDIVGKSAPVTFSIFISGDHLYNISVRTVVGKQEVVAQSWHFNPFVAVTGACTNLERRLQSMQKAPH